MEFLARLCGKNNKSAKITFNFLWTIRRPLHHSTEDILLPAKKELLKERIHHYIYASKGYELQAVNAGVPRPSQMANPALPGQSFSDHSKVYFGWRSPNLSFSSSSIFLKGYMALKLYLHDIVRPNHMSAFRALERFFSEKERHEDCLSRYLQKERSLTETKVACVLTQHLISQLLPHPTNFILDKNSKGKSAECPCGCGAPMLYGTTIVGSPELFYGNADLVLFPSDEDLFRDVMDVMESSSVIITIPEYFFEKGYEEDDINEHELAKKDLPEVMPDEAKKFDQVLKQAISVSLCKHRQIINKNLTKNNISAVPVCLITKETYFVAVYDASYDYLMRTNKTLKLFEGNNLRFDAVLDLWLLIHHNLFCSTPHQKVLREFKGTCDLIPQLGRERFEKMIQSSRWLYMPECMHPDNSDNVSAPKATVCEQKEERQARWTMEMQELAKCKKEVDKACEYEKVVDTKVKNDDVLLCMFTSIMASVREFYNDLKDFMIDNKLNRCTEGAYRELCRAFLKACGLESRDGDTMNKMLQIGELSVKSVPDLRCCLRDDRTVIDYFRQIEVETVVMIGEVKKWKRNWKLQRTMDFRSQELQPCHVLGQHGGALLLESNDTCFKIGIDSRHQPSRLVYGAIVIGTQIVFTALEISEQHLTDIENVRTDKGEIDDEVNVGHSTIFYTRPYDFLKSSDRSLIYESVLRLACYQKGLK